MVRQVSVNSPFIVECEVLQTTNGAGDVLELTEATLEPEDDEPVEHPIPQPFRAQTDGEPAAPSAPSTPRERRRKMWTRGATRAGQGPVNPDVDQAAEDVKVPPLPRGGIVQKKLVDIYTYFGMGVMMATGDQVCAQAIIDAAPECAKALEEMAKTNPNLRRVLLKVISGSSYAMLIQAHLPILMAIATHHSGRAFTPGTAPAGAPDGLA